MLKLLFKQQSESLKEGLIAHTVVLLQEKSWAFLN